MAISVCRVPVVRHSAKTNLHRVFFLALGKVHFAECIFLALGKYSNFFHCRPQNFFTQYIQHVVLHVQIWCIFNVFYIFYELIVFSSIFLNQIKFELQVIQIYEKNE